MTFPALRGSEEVSYVYRAHRQGHNQVPRITASCIRVSWDAATAAAGTRYARECVLGPFLKMVTDAMTILALEARPFLRARTINTRIICVSLNDRHFSVELLVRDAPDWEMRCIPLGGKHLCSNHTRDPDQKWHVRADSIVYSRKYFRWCARLCRRDYRRRRR